MSIDRSTILIGDQEWELRVAIPGRILPEAQWTKLPSEQPLPVGNLKPIDLSPPGCTESLVLDLGCGNGRFSLLSSLARPTLTHVAIDSDPMHLRYLRRRLRQRGVENVRLFVGDAGDLLARLEPGGAAEIHIYHPQPWHEAGLSHRRLLHPAFQLDAFRALKDGGAFCLQTDSKPYANYLRGTLSFLFERRELAERESWPDGLGKPRGRRELVATQEGLTIWRCVCYKRQIDMEEATALAATLPSPAFKSDRRASAHRRSKANRGEHIRG